MVSEDNVKWDEETDYLFLRNNVPNMAKLRGEIITFNLKIAQRPQDLDLDWDWDLDLSIFNSLSNLIAAKLKLRRGCRAYACGCQWRNITEVTSPRDAGVQWICRKH